MIQSYRSGQQLGPYRLLRLLGQSDHSTVYAGEQIHSHAQVAIKLLNGQRTGKEAANFLSQASSLLLLQHPHIVRVLDHGIDNGTAFLVMRYVPNGTLRQLYPKGTRVPLATIVSYVNQIADALHYVHQRFLVHRDVKPHNMLLGAHNEVLLSDFGIAIISHSIDPLLPEMCDFEGTVPYAAPEQLQGQSRRSSDQYALGIVVYEWLSGDWPFSGTFDEIAHQHLLIQAPSFREKHIAVPVEVEQVVMKALSKEPDRRFATIKEFASTLEGAYQATRQDSSSQDMPSSPLKRQFLPPFPFPRK